MSMNYFENSGGWSRTNHSFRLRYERSQHPTACPRKLFEYGDVEIVNLYQQRTLLYLIVALAFIIFEIGVCLWNSTTVS